MLKRIDGPCVHVHSRGGYQVSSPYSFNIGPLIGPRDPCFLLDVEFLVSHWT